MCVEYRKSSVEDPSVLKRAHFDSLLFRSFWGVEKRSAFGMFFLCVSDSPLQEFLDLSPVAQTPAHASRGS